jgi:hypothetical protein
MSWQGMLAVTLLDSILELIWCLWPVSTAYVDDSMLKSGKIAKGAILGVQGGIWAISSGYNVSQISSCGRGNAC